MVLHFFCGEFVDFILNDWNQIMREMKDFAELARSFADFTDYVPNAG